MKGLKKYYQRPNKGDFVEGFISTMQFFELNWLMYGDTLVHTFFSTFTKGGKKGLHSRIDGRWQRIDDSKRTI